MNLRRRRGSVRLWLAGLLVGLAVGAGAVLLWWSGSGRGDVRPVGSVTLAATQAQPAELARDLRTAVAAGDWEAANALETRLAAKGARAIPALRDILEHEPADTPASVGLAQRAASALGRIGGPEVELALAGAMDRHHNSEVRGQVLLALGRSEGTNGGAARAVLESVLLSPAEPNELRSSAALLLAKRPEPEATARVAAAARQRQDLHVTRWGIDALGFSRHPDIAAPLLRELVQNEPDQKLRAAAARSVARLEGAGALELLDSRLRSDESAHVRREIVRAIAEMASLPQTRPLLARTLARDDNQGVRALAAAALGRPGQGEELREGNLRTLAAALEAERILYVRMKIVAAIGKVGGKRAEEILDQVARSDRFVPVRGHARATLRRLRGQEGHGPKRPRVEPRPLEPLGDEEEEKGNPTGATLDEPL